ncbi:unnamed protein product, partial [Nesidiocoris tenuis]
MDVLCVIWFVAVYRSGLCEERFASSCSGAGEMAILVLLLSPRQYPLPVPADLVAWETLLACAGQVPKQDGEVVELSHGNCPPSFSAACKLVFFPLKFSTPMAIFPLSSLPSRLR